MIWTLVKVQRLVENCVVQGIVWQAGDVLTASSVNDEAHFTDDVECVSVSGSQERNNILNLTFLTCTLLHSIIGLD